MRKNSIIICSLLYFLILSSNVWGGSVDSCSRRTIYYEDMVLPPVPQSLQTLRTLFEEAYTNDDNVRTAFISGLRCAMLTSLEQTNELKACHEETAQLLYQLEPEIRQEVASKISHSLPCGTSAEYQEMYLKIAIEAAKATNDLEWVIMDTFNIAAGYWSQNDFPTAKQYFQQMKAFLEEYWAINPLDQNSEILRKILMTNKPARQYVRFFINTDAVRPHLCKGTPNCLELSWEMTQKIKSRLFRIDILRAVLFQKDEEQRNRLFALISKEEQLIAEKGRFLMLSDLNYSDHRIQRINQGIEQIQTQISNIAPEYQFFSDANIPSLKEVSDSLEPNETFLSFFYNINYRPIHVWKLEKGKPPQIIQLIKAEELNLLINNLYEAITCDDNDADCKNLAELRPQLKELSDSIIKPLNLENNRHLIIAVDENMTNLPFEILPFGQQQEEMYNYFDITYIPSGTMFYLLRKNRTTYPAPQYDLDYAGFGWDGLPYIEPEIKNSARHFKRSIAKSNANKFDILQSSDKISQCRYLHFATHSIIHEDNSLSLLFNSDDDNVENKILSSAEIMSHLRNHAELVILSACRTAPTISDKDQLLHVMLGNLEVTKIQDDRIVYSYEHPSFYNFR